MLMRSCFSLQAVDYVETPAHRTLGGTPDLISHNTTDQE
jgi:hypothetical protein